MEHRLVFEFTEESLDQKVIAGTCAIAAYDQDRIDKLLRLDSDEEFVIYMAPVGKKLQLLERCLFHGIID